MSLLTRTVTLIGTSALLASAGCFSLGRDTPVLQQYVLGGSRVAERVAPPPNPAGLALGVRRLDLASYLAIPAIIVRRGEHQIVVSEFRRWGEPLGQGISRAVARHLASSGSVRAVDVAPWSVRSRYDYLIQVHISRFEGVASEEVSATDGEAHVLAAWEISRQVDGVVLARGATDYRERGWTIGDYSELVTLLDAGLGVLAGDVVACLGSLGSTTARTVGAAAPASHRPSAGACAARSE